jgi:hypothetical protein
MLTFLIDDLFQRCSDPSRAAMGFFGVKSALPECIAHSLAPAPAR